MMKTTKDYSTAATVLSNLADDCKPQDPKGKYANAENLIVFHLRSAAAKAREIAEHKAAEEPEECPNCANPPHGDSPCKRKKGRAA